MGSFGITILITILIGLWGSKSLKKILPADMEVENDSDAMPEEAFADEDCFMDESSVRREPSVRVDPKQVSVLEEDDLLTDQNDDFQFDLRQAVVYDTILRNEHTGIR